MDTQNFINDLKNQKLIFKQENVADFTNQQYVVLPFIINHRNHNERTDFNDNLDYIEAVVDVLNELSDTVRNLVIDKLQNDL